jgi:hypothetical protein
VPSAGVKLSSDSSGFFCDRLREIRVSGEPSLADVTMLCSHFSSIRK